MVISLTAPWLLILELVSEGIGNRPILRAVLSINYLEKKKKLVTIPGSHSKIWCSALVIYPSNDEPQARMTQRKMIFPLPIFFASNFNKKYKIPSIHCSKTQSHPDSSFYFFFHCQSIVNSVDFSFLKSLSCSPSIPILVRVPQVFSEYGGSSLTSLPAPSLGVPFTLCIGTSVSFQKQSSFHIISLLKVLTMCPQCMEWGPSSWAWCSRTFKSGTFVVTHAGQQQPSHFLIYTLLGWA